MNEGNDLQYLFEKKYHCPICDFDFTSMKVRNSRLKIDKRETDLQVVYKDFTPSYYSIIVCPVCGYAASESRYSKLKPAQREAITKEIINKWQGNSYSGLRSATDAVVTMKLGIKIAQVGHFPDIEIAFLALNLAWI